MIDPIAPTLLPLKYNNKPLARNLGAGDVAAQNDLYYKLFAAEPFTGKANEELPQQSEVNSFHNYAVHQLGVDLHPLYVCSNQNVEAFQHNVLPIIGIMWHPERETTPQSIDTYLFGSLFGERNEI